MFAKNRDLIILSKGQSVVEYLAFFAVIAALTLLSVCVLYPRVHQSGQSAFQQAIEEILR